MLSCFLFFFSSRRRHTRSLCDWSSDVCSSDLSVAALKAARLAVYPSSSRLKSRISQCEHSRLGRRPEDRQRIARTRDRKSTRLNSSHTVISYAVFCLKKKTIWGFIRVSHNEGT